MAATHSRCTRDGLHVGSSMVRCGLRAALGVRRLYRPPAPSPLWCTRLHCRGHILRAMKSSAPKRRGSGRSVERSEEHTSELQSLAYLVCRLLLEKKKNN